MSKAIKLLSIVLGAIIILCAGGYWASTKDGKNDSAQTTRSYTDISEQESDTQTTEAAGISVQTSTESNSAASTTKAANYESSTKSNTTNNTRYEYAYAGFNPKTVVINKEKWFLILVNRDNILPKDFSVSLSPAVKGVNEMYRLDSRVAAIYNTMYNDAKKDGCTLTPCSGYRTIASQKAKFESDITKYMSQGKSKVVATQMAALNRQPPGCSEHNTGLAMDIANVDISFENSKESKWLNAHAADYGFILRYPENKTQITKVNYEPWHWRYVGVEAAKDMKTNHPDLCLEEYLKLIN